MKRAGYGHLPIRKRGWEMGTWQLHRLAVLLLFLAARRSPPVAWALEAGTGAGSQVEIPLIGNVPTR